MPTLAAASILDLACLAVLIQDLDRFHLRRPRPSLGRYADDPHRRRVVINAS
jgi:hypothetical protein